MYIFTEVIAFLITVYILYKVSFAINSSFTEPLIYQVSRTTLTSYLSTLSRNARNQILRKR